MSEMNNDFGSALQAALESSNALRDTRATVKKLVAELSAAVAAKLPGVSIELMRRGDLRVGVLDTLHRLGSVMTESRPRRLGDDAEDRDVSLLVVATAGSENRILWELDLADEGFPVTVRGPVPGKSHYCSGEEELRQAFVGAVGTSVVGRKLQTLSRQAAKQASVSTGE